MKIYKIERVWSFNTMTSIPGFREEFPELKGVSYEELCNRWANLGIELYTQKKKEVPFWTRLTLPFALITFVLMFISLPVVFILTGKWGFPVGKGKIYNWFKALRLL